MKLVVAGGAAPHSLFQVFENVVFVDVVVARKTGQCQGNNVRMMNILSTLKLS